MAFYAGLRGLPQGEKARVARNLLRLREELSKQGIPRRTVDETLLLATWNVREFGARKPKYGRRIPESFYYIAEVVSAFDLVAVQEVNENLGDLERVMRILGRRWDYIATDVTEGRSGNEERMAFVYDTRKVSFQNVAGEVVLPEGKLVGGSKQLSRTPFLVAFRSGWFKFKLCTVHIYYGAASGTKFERRVQEIRSVGKFIGRRAKGDRDYNYVLLGDFNIVTPDCDTMSALAGSGFVIPPEISRPTNITEDKFYDQIAFMAKPGELRLGDSPTNANIFKYFDAVFRDAEFDDYRKAITETEKRYPRFDDAKKKTYYGTWRTFQMSDHYPLWVELKINFSKEYLERLAG